MLFLMKERIFSWRSVSGSVMPGHGTEHVHHWSSFQPSGGDAVHAHGSGVRAGGDVEELLAAHGKPMRVDDAGQAGSQPGRSDEREIRDLRGRRIRGPVDPDAARRVVADVA